MVNLLIKGINICVVIVTGSAVCGFTIGSKEGRERERERE
jgi:hypothetical protein